jgi:BON domain
MTRRSRILAAAVLGLAMAPPLAARAADPPSGTGGLPTLPPVLAPAKPAAPPSVAAPTLPVAVVPPVAKNAAPLALDGVPAPKQATSRDVASAVAETLRQAGKAGQVRHYSIDVLVKDGTTELSGTVAGPQQREEVLKLVRGVAGVGPIVDKLTILAPNPIAQVQATAPGAPVLQPPPIPTAPTLQPPFGAAPPGPEAAPPQFREPLPAPNGPAGVIPEPIPAFAAPMPSPYDMNPPQMPPYAWPTYAPYNNLSRVAYPLNYPYQSWPNIGPCYPFPKIPPSWRSVKLEWEDGHWWFSRTATQEGYWRLRFW